MKSPYNSFYGIRNAESEIDLRDELDRTLNGAIDEIRKGHQGLIRTMRKDSDGNFVRCPCRSKVTDEPDKDYYCRFCMGHGYLWDETKIVYYKNEDSFLVEKGVLFYLQYDKEISSEDYIVEIELDNEGEPIMPVTRSRVYSIEKAQQYRSDRGRIEFWQVRAKYERKWSVWYGVKNRQH